MAFKSEFSCSTPLTHWHVTEKIDRRTSTTNSLCSKFRRCVKVQVDILGSLSLILVIVCMVSVDVKQHLKKNILYRPLELYDRPL